MNRQDLQDLSEVRLKEARALLKEGLWDGAYYLAGYSIECALKACIARSTAQFDFPEKKKVDASYSHELDALVKVAGLEPALKAQIKNNPVFRRYWETTEEWSEQSRYERNAEKAARELITAIDDQRYGILVWIKQHW